MHDVGTKVEAKDTEDVTFDSAFKDEVFFTRTLVLSENINK